MAAQSTDQGLTLLYPLPGETESQSPSTVKISQPTQSLEKKKSWRARRGVKSPNTSSSASDKKAIYWPADLLPSAVPMAKIWTYGYNANVVDGFFQKINKNSILQHGNDFMVKVERSLKNDLPIIVVAHSLGGLVVKRAMERMQSDVSPRYKQFLRRIQAVVLCGTPHRGSDTAAWAGLATNLVAMAFMDTHSKMLSDLRVDSAILDLIQEDFMNLLHDRPIRIHSFQEGRGLTGVKGLHNKGRILVVDDVSSKLGWLRETVETIDADHREMVKKLGVKDISDVLAGLEQELVKDSQKPETTQTLNQAEPEAHTFHPTCHVIPFIQNNRFVGRTEILGKLKQNLFTQKESQKVAIFGLGGVGKTQVALQFAFWVKKHRPCHSIFWVSALSYGSFELGCTEIAKKLGIHKSSNDESPMELVKRHLSSDSTRPWLLIVDNADDSRLLFGTSDVPGGLSQYFPASETGVTLFTTRSRAVAVPIADGDMIEVKKMDSKEATEVFEKWLYQKDLLCDKSGTSQLLEELQYLPLAIRQAAAYLDTTQVSIDKYLAMLRGTDQEVVSLLSRQFHDNTRYSGSQNAIATAWLVSFEQIRKSDRFAADLLTFISCIEPKAIPLSILPKPKVEEQMTHAMGILRSYAFMVKRQVFNMHSLVHLATKIWVQKEGFAAQAIENAASYLITRFSSQVVANRNLWRDYLPHAHRVLRGSNAQDMKLGYPLFWLVGGCLYQDGRIKEAVRCFEDGWKGSIYHCAEDHSQRLGYQYVLALAYISSGQTEEGIRMVEHVVAAQETLAKERLQLRLQTSLAKAYAAKGQHNKAIDMLGNAVAAAQRTPAEDYPSLLYSQSILAEAYMANGQGDKAIEMLENAVAAAQKTLAEDQIQLRLQTSLAKAYAAKGQHNKAIDMLGNAVAAAQKTLADDHPSLLYSQSKLAAAYMTDGQADKAMRLVEHVAALHEKIFPEGHPSLLSSKDVLAVVYEVSGQIDKALQLLKHVVTVKKRTLAEGHPELVSSQQALADAYRRSEMNSSK